MWWGVWESASRRLRGGHGGGRRRRGLREGREGEEGGSGGFEWGGGAAVDARGAAAADRSARRQACSGLSHSLPARARPASAPPP